MDGVRTGPENGIEWNGGQRDGIDFVGSKQQIGLEIPFVSFRPEYGHMFPFRVAIPFRTVENFASPSRAFDE